MEVGQRERRTRTNLSQINVTPFVDVMLVLLIIFMVTAPMMETGVEVKLPEVEEAPTLDAAQEPLVVTVKADGTIFVGRSQVASPAKLIPVVTQILQERQKKEVFLEADRAVPYGKVVPVMAAIRRAGVAKLGMVADRLEP
jgi:biopolymer transport protein TolR